MSELLHFTTGRKRENVALDTHFRRFIRNMKFVMILQTIWKASGRRRFFAFLTNGAKTAYQIKW